MQGVCAFFSPFPSETHSKPAVPGDAEAVCAPAFRSAGEGALKLPEEQGEGEALRLLFFPFFKPSSGRGFIGEEAVIKAPAFPFFMPFSGRAEASGKRQ